MPAPEPLRGRSLVLVAIAAVVLSAAFRAPLILQSGGLTGAGSTDDGVHFAAAASLVAGRLPYRDFLFLHPPGVVLALTPFAALARPLGDVGAFAAARAVFIGIGAANAGLVVLVLRRFGWVGAVSGAAVSALAWPDVFAERSALLEPLGCSMLLTGLALTAGAEASRRRRIVGGVALGLAVIVKLAFVLPALIVILAAGRRAPTVLVGAVGAATAVCLPFVLLAPADMWREVVLDQAGRRRIVPSIEVRLADIVMPPVVPGVPQRVVLTVLLTVMAVLVMLALVTPGAKRFAVLFVTGIATLLASPSFYGHYAIIAVLPAALLVGVGAARVQALGRPRPARVAVVGATWAVVLGVVLGAWTPARIALLSTPSAPIGLVDAARGLRGCVTADAATTLIETGILTEQLERGCPVWPDFTGWEFDRDARFRDGVPLWPNVDPAWQAHARAYLISGSAVMLTWKKDGLSAATRARVLSGPAVWSGQGDTVHRVVRR